MFTGPTRFRRSASGVTIQDAIINEVRRRKTGNGLTIPLESHKMILPEFSLTGIPRRAEGDIDRETRGFETSL